MKVTDERMKAWTEERYGHLRNPENAFSLNRPAELIAALERELELPIWDTTTMGIEGYSGNIEIVSFTREEAREAVSWLKKQSLEVK